VSVFVSLEMQRSGGASTHVLDLSTLGGQAILLLIIAAPALVYATVRRALPNVAPSSAVIYSVAAVVALLMALGSWRMRPFRETIAHARPDLLLLTVLAACAAFSRGRLARGLSIATVVAVVSVTSTALLRVLYASITGATVSPDLLTYFASNLGDVLPVVASEADAGRLLLLGLPALLLPVLMIVSNRAAGLRTNRESGVEAGWPLAATALVVLIWPGLVRAGSSSSVGLVAQALATPSVCAEPIMPGARSPEPVAADVTFVRTSRTQPFNVVVVLLESFRARSVTPFDSSETITPFLSQLLRRGVEVPRLYAAVNHTNRRSGPSLLVATPIRGRNTSRPVT
jgi:hypothetical protein